MKLQDQVTPLQEAIRLKELGVKQESVWSWYITTDRDDTPSLNRSGYHCPTCGHPRMPYFAEVAAFGVAELGLLLVNEENGYDYSIGYEHPTWDFFRRPTFMEERKEISSHATEAEARSAMLVFLLENKLITAEEVNARL